MARDEAEGVGEKPVVAENKPFETVKALVFAVVLALTIRAFLFEPFKIPSGSMIPTLLVGDYIVVNKFSYGVRLPITGTLVIPVGEPDRGDVVVFRYPDDPNIDYIKRVVGIPGDKVEIRRGRLWVNDQPVDRISEGLFSYMDYRQKREETRDRYREVNESGVEYTIIQDATRSHGPGRRRVWRVPEGKFFMMGDNRDNSRDSRLWNEPFVSGHQLKGRAIFVHWSWVVSSGAPNQSFVMDLLNTLYRVVTFQVEEIRWHRIGRPLRGAAD
jgi:signal peptidase I